MSDFTEIQDQKIIQFASKCISTKIKWAELVSKQPVFYDKTAKQIGNRYQTLKRRFGPSINDFPPWFFGKKSQRSAKSRKSSQEGDVKKIDLLVLATMACDNEVCQERDAIRGVVNQQDRVNETTNREMNIQSFVDVSQRVSCLLSKEAFMLLFIFF